ncbi:exonuclease subunit SbcD [uncultured Tissierella sp.]|uniref:exonuclease subunit SbcD n=1 Tax=uncultured Tissierella sp. TaxID=448160 RepID=UPI0028053BB5|nr:exonuclease subunit SbcD [uncultured Tissierella sp.]MDU5080272.1 exonuclease subunit SbcD [Bacillota bacterium]
MKILHSSDWHIGNFQGPEKNGVNLRSRDIYNCLEFMLEKAKEEQPDLIVITGDLFHTAKVWADRGLNETYNAINIINQLSAISPVVILRGTPNHDGDEQFNMMKEVFRYKNSIIIFDKPAVRIIQTKSGSINVAALPGFERGTFRAKFPGLSKEEENQVFTTELANIVLGLRSMCYEGNPSILMAHYTVPGANIESGQIQFFSQFEPVLTPEVLDAANFDLVTLGHIHRPQKLMSCQNTYYAGAINALNFNDEGQQRGFWIHELGSESKFIETPYREFTTYRFTNRDITAINMDGLDHVAIKWWGHDGVKDKIVRILYSCTDENNKAFNKALLEKRLYEDGAFWVQEITPEKITITANRNELSERSAPEDNLRDYLLEKAIPDERIAEIIEAARPIIAEAIAKGLNSSLTGLFIPVEVEVKNYRNYVEETFNFEDITFCTINGKNGVGKSSLFMDAILDCLYEEPREGDLTGWISNNEKARSGSIKFTFKIGDKIFRVTRTRTKSGKATLNISELIEGEWIDRSKERLNDTQAEIINIIGMDSLTLRSCALIMQDQYGIFLQADKEKRMNILGNILGLGIYEDMETISKENATEINREIRQHQYLMDQLYTSMPDEMEVNKNIESIQEEITVFNKDIKEKTEIADNIKLRLNSKIEAANRALKIKEGLTMLNNKKKTIEENRHTQIDIITNSNVILEQEEIILANVSRHNQLLEEEKILIKEKALYDTKLSEANKQILDIESIDLERINLIREKTNLKSKKEPYEAKLLLESDLKEKYQQYIQEKGILTTLEEKTAQYISLSNEYSQIEKEKVQIQSEYDKEYSRRIVEYNVLKEKAALLENSGCIDKENAKCKFLADAQTAKTRLITYKEECSKWKDGIKKDIENVQDKLNLIRDKINTLGYDSEAIKDKRISVAELEKSSKEYEALEGYKEQLTLINDRIKAIDIKLNELTDKINILKTNNSEIKEQLLRLNEAAVKYDQLILQIKDLEVWLEREKLLPVAREKKAIAEARITELDNELVDIASEMMNKEQDLEIENRTASGSEELKTELDLVENIISGKQLAVQKLSMEIGAYKKQLEDIENSKDEISRLQKTINDLSEKVTILEELKKAFNQDGIPHNIIRAILPMIEATANNILGQMSGGKMSMEFVTEKVLKSNNKKEVVTLDIIINETGIGKLPYLSKSGGERVKSALSAILALAEIKSSRAGIQLGMLFIDEPPFLDGAGIQAYCDALETIQSRYKDLKIMAITHDPTMKARFPQSIDIIKTEEGSRVILG